MEANELRIGNWVKEGKVSGIYRFYNDEPYSIEVEETDGTFMEIFIQEIEPIPLTPKWLTRAGFEKKVDGLVSTKWHIGINPITNDYLFDITWLSNFDRPFYRNGHFKIDYVHQLQNIYFALTGTELEFK